MLDWRSGWGVVAVVSVFASGCTRGNPQFADTVDEGTAGGDDVAGDDGVGDGVDDGLDDGGEGSGSGAGDDGADDGATSGDSGGDETPVDRCGNGMKDTGEQCDFGPDNSFEGECLPDCTHNVCGDGHTSPTQPCDGDEGCSPECTWVTCGNGMTEAETEACDWSDPKTAENCTPVCTINICGDTHILGEETCDDANNDESDGCTSLCQPPVCGDALISEDIGEVCDDDDDDNTDECVLCQQADCGDGFVHAGVEDCDPEDPVNSDTAFACANEGGVVGVFACSVKDCVWASPVDNCCIANGAVTPASDLCCSKRALGDTCMGG